MSQVLSVLALQLEQKGDLAATGAGVCAGVEKIGFFFYRSSEGEEKMHIESDGNKYISDIDALSIDSVFHKEIWDQEGEGVYYSKENTIITAFSGDLQDELFELEDKSWWFQYRAEVIVGFMDRFFNKTKAVFDIGGGNGYTSSIAVKNGYAVGLIEPSRHACHHAKDRGVKRIFCGTVSDDTVKDDSIEQFLLLDVLEHIENDRAFLSILNKKTAPNGLCLITVPAFMFVWNSEDDVAGHFRRYRIKPLCDLIKDCGFDVCYSSYFFGFLLIPIFIMRVMFEKLGIIKRCEERSDKSRKRIRQIQFASRAGVVNSILKCFEYFEERIMEAPNRVWFGSSILVIARKKRL